MMQEIFILSPYRFIPARKSRWISRLNRWLRLHRWLMWRLEGVRGCDLRGVSHLRQSLEAGHSILLAPNHSRTADPIALGFISEALRLDMYAMASWHLFNQGWLARQFVQAVGAFSVNREGLDRTAIDFALKILESNDRPLVIFPEGSTSRTSERLMPFLDGLSFIARAGAKRREARDGGKTVIHPVAIRYAYQGDAAADVQPVLDEIEQRLTWQPGRVADLLPRIQRIGLALLAIKELEVFGNQQHGSLEQRLAALIDRLLHPLEEKWLGGHQTGTTSTRIKNLRTRILPEMTDGRVPPPQRPARFADLRDTYVAHQLACFPLSYLAEYPSLDRIRETVERFEEDTTDRARLFRPLKCIMEIGPPVEVATHRVRRGSDTDSLMQEISQRLQSMLTELGRESPLYSADSSPPAEMTPP